LLVLLATLAPCFEHRVGQLPHSSIIHSSIGELWYLLPVYLCQPGELSNLDVPSPQLRTAVIWDESDLLLSSAGVEQCTQLHCDYTTLYVLHATQAVASARLTSAGFFFGKQFGGGVSLLNALIC
jgi:hypothetical protein